VNKLGAWTPGRKRCSLPWANGRLAKNRKYTVFQNKWDRIGEKACECAGCCRHIACTAAFALRKPADLQACRFCQVQPFQSLYNRRFNPTEIEARTNAGGLRLKASAQLKERKAGTTPTL
jgi:hypothetical protein